jgi:MFS family permease
MTPQENTMNGDAAVRSQHSDEKQMANRAALSSIAGSALEWLDFAAYGAIAATVLPQLFFSKTDTTTAALAAFATFSVGFIARPLGGLICGYLGDRVGRRNMLVFTFLLMGICSFLIGILPTYASIGVLAHCARGVALHAGLCARRRSNGKSVAHDGARAQEPARLL